MVGTIRPIVHGARNEKTVRPQTLHFLGCVAGGAIAGAVVGSLGGALRADLLIAHWPAGVAITVGALHILGAGRDLGFVSFPLPQSSWQVPRRWRYDWPARRVAIAYGTLLGMNVFTRMPTPGLHLAMLWVLLIGDTAIGAATLALCGAARALPIVMLADKAGGIPIDRVIRQVSGLQSAAFVLMGLLLAVSGAWLIAVGVMRTW